MLKIITLPARLVLRHTPLNCAMFNPVLAVQAVAEGVEAVRALERELSAAAEDWSE